MSALDPTRLVPFTAGTAALLAVIYVVAGAIHDARSRRRERVFGQSREAFAAVLFGDQETAAANVAALERLPPDLILNAGKRMVTDFGGQVSERISFLVSALGLTKRIRAQIHARAWRRRAQGAALAVLLTPGDPDRVSLLRDRHPTVRARAVEGLDAEAVESELAQVFALLDDVNEGVRMGAQQALIRVGAAAVPALAEHLRCAEGHSAVLGLEVAASAFDPRLREVVEFHARSLDATTRAMAVRAMPFSVVDEAVIRSLLSDEDPTVRATTAIQVGAAGREALASAVGRQLGDGAWAVRHAAGGALRDLGASGLMTLRVALGDEDRYARDMARQTLDAMATRRGSVAAVIPARADDSIDDWDFADRVPEVSVTAASPAEAGA